MPIISKVIRKVRSVMPNASELDMVIPPEVINDAFSQAIRQFVADPLVHFVLEIGSSDGSGSTASVFAAMEGKADRQLHCLELSKPRFEKLSQRYSMHDWVHCHNLPSVARDRMPTPQDVADFYRRFPESPLCAQKLEKVQGWLRQDIDYIDRFQWPNNGINAARNAAGIDTFDLVLIDGSEFTGEAELDELYGARYVLLDDTQTFKNHVSLLRLRGDERYELVAEDATCRNGFAAFRLR